MLVSRVQSVEKIEHWFNVLRSKAALILIKSADRTLHWQWGALHRRDQTQSRVSARKLLSLLIWATYCLPITAGKQIISRKRVLQACACLMRWLVRKWLIKNRKWRQKMWQMMPPTLECEALINGTDWNYSNQLNSPREQWSVFNSDMSAWVETVAQRARGCMFIESLQLCLSAAVSEHTDALSWLRNKERSHPAVHDLFVSSADGWMCQHVRLDKTLCFATVWDF